MNSMPQLEPINPLLKLVAWTAVFAAGAATIWGVFAGTWWSSIAFVLLATFAMLLVIFLGIDTQSRLRVTLPPASHSPSHRKAS